MEQKISNKEDFDAKLKQLGDLYEEGKDCVNTLSGHACFRPDLDPTTKRLYDILREMRDLAATQMQAIHWQEEN